MGRELANAMPTARAVLQEVDEALKQHLSRLMFEGPEAELTLTENAQPALMALSMAVVRVLEEEGGGARSAPRPSSWPAIRSASTRRWRRPGP